MPVSVGHGNASLQRKGWPGLSDLLPSGHFQAHRKLVFLAVKVKEDSPRPKALDRIQQVLTILAGTDNSGLCLCKLAEKEHRDRDSNLSLQRKIKELRAELAEFANPTRRLQKGAVNRDQVTPHH